MGLIVAAPTAGSCGILPGAIVTIGKEYDIDDEPIISTIPADAIAAAAPVSA